MEELFKPVVFVYGLADTVNTTLMFRCDTCSTILNHKIVCIFFHSLYFSQHTKWNTTATPSRPSRVSTPASPNPLYSSSRPVDIGSNRRVSTPHAGSYSTSKTKSFDEDRSHMPREQRVLSPENRTRHPASRSLHQGVDATDLLKPKAHHRRKSETDFTEKEWRKSDPYSPEIDVNTSYLPDDCKVSLEELTEAGAADDEKHSEEQRTDSSRASDGSDKINKQIKRHTSLTSLTTLSVTKTPPSSRRKGMSQHRSLDIPDHHFETGSLLSPVKATPSFTTSSPIPDIINALTNEE